MWEVRTLEDYSRRQFGLVTRAQALEVMSLGQLRGLRTRGVLTPVHQGVFRLAGASGSWRQRAMAAHLAYGPPSAISHCAAGRMWGLESIVADHPEITLPTNRNGRRAGITTHRAPLPPADIAWRYGIPVTTLGRTLSDLAGITSSHLLERATDQALRQRLVAPEELAEYVRAHRGSGHRGVEAFRAVLHLRLEHPGIGDSEMADRVFTWIVESGLEPPQRQVQVVVGERVMILDMAYPDRKIAIEFDGFDYHGRRHRFDSDAERYDELVLAGWTVLRVTSKHSRDRVVAMVRRVLG